MFIKEVQFFESHSKKGSNLWVIVKKKVQFIETYFQKMFDSWSHFQKKEFYFFESCYKKGLRVKCKKRFNSESHIKLPFLLLSSPPTLRSRYAHDLLFQLARNSPSVCASDLLSSQHDKSHGRILLGQVASLPLPSHGLSEASWSKAMAEHLT